MQRWHHDEMFTILQQWRYFAKVAFTDQLTCTMVNLAANQDHLFGEVLYLQRTQQGRCKYTLRYYLVPGQIL